jgi:glycosyltransferase involved in cell wall biosynthesis
VIRSDSNERLRILHLVVSLGAANTEYNEHCLPLMHERDVTVCSFTIARVTVPPAIRLFEGDDTYRGFWRALRAALDHGPYDVVHAHAPRSATLLLLMNLRRRASMANCVYTAHNSFHNFRPIGRLLLFPVVAVFPTVVMCSMSAFRSFPPALRRLGRNIVVVQNGVDTERVRNAVSGFQPSGSQNSFVVVWVGRLLPRKNPITALAAFEQAFGDGCRLVFVGDGESRGELQREIVRRGLESRVTITGLVEREEVYRHLACGDVFLSLSHGEGLPVAVLEAMACGLPVILSDIPPHSEIADGADFIPLVPPLDVGRAVGELRRLRDMPGKDRTLIGERCRGLVESRFSLHSMYRGYEGVYARLMSRSPSADRTKRVGLR